MQIVFYNMNKDARYVDKSDALTQMTSLDVKLKKRPNNIRSFSLELDMDPEDVSFNYCFIPKFGRYYYVGEPVSLVNGMIQVPLECDLLMTYKDKIYATSQLVERNAKHINAYLHDNMITNAAYEMIDCMVFPNGVTSDSIILITAG